MRLTPIFVGLSLALAAQGSWFGGDDNSKAPAQPYSTWSASQLRNWLDIHNIGVPKQTSTPSETELRALVADNWNGVTTWTYDQYASAQKAFTDLRDSSFDTWDESRLREWLLEQGFVAPKGPREKLVLMAKEQYRQYMQAASSFSAHASATAASLGSQASKSASTAVYGDAGYQASKSLESIVARATTPVMQTFDESKDYAYSTWDEAQLRRYLVEKGMLKSKEQKRKEELYQMMHNAYGRVANPVWSVWSDSYMHGWLVAHNIIKSGPQKQRDYYTELMKNYYYSTSENVWDTWSDSQLRDWLVTRGVIKSDAQVTRDKMLRLVKDNYASAKDTFWDAWSDNQIKGWLVENGYMRSDAQVKRDELIKAAEARYNDYNARTAAYLTWPDARLRAYLREHGVSEDFVPGGRPGLLQEVRIRWVQTENRAESMLARVKELVNDSANKVEDVLGTVLSVLTNGMVDIKSRSENQYDAAKEGYDDVKGRTEKEIRDARKAGEKQYYEAKHAGEKQYGAAKGQAERAGSWAGEKGYEARQNAGEKVKQAGATIKGDAEL